MTETPFTYLLLDIGTSLVALMVKTLHANAEDIGDVGSIPGLGRSPGGENGNPLQYSYLENPMDREAWWAAVYGVTKELDMTELLTVSLFTFRSEPRETHQHPLPLASQDCWQKY